MDILEVLQYLSEKYSFDENDVNLVDEITNQIINTDYDEDKEYEKYDEGEYEDEDEYDIAEER